MGEVGSDDLILQHALTVVSAALDARGTVTLLGIGVGLDPGEAGFGGFE